MIQRSRFPTFTEVRFDTRHQTSGQHSLYLGLNGGNVGAFLKVGTLPALPDSDYLISAQIQSSQLKHAGARLVAYFVDSVGKRIDDRIRESRVIQTEDSWQQHAVQILGDYPDAAWIGMEVELVQPQPITD